MVLEARRKVDVVLDKFWGREDSCAQRGVEAALIADALQLWDREEAYYYKNKFEAKRNIRDTILTFPKVIEEEKGEEVEEEEEGEQRKQGPPSNHLTFQLISQSSAEH